MYTFEEAAALLASPTTFTAGARTSPVEGQAGVRAEGSVAVAVEGGADGGLMMSKRMTRTQSSRAQ